MRLTVEGAKRECSGCASYHPKGLRSGECRKRTPTAQPNIAGVSRVWPGVNADDWCGQFEAKQPGEAAFP